VRSINSSIHHTDNNALASRQAVDVLNIITLDRTLQLKVWIIVSQQLICLDRFNRLDSWVCIKLGYNLIQSLLTAELCNNCFKPQCFD